MGVVIIYGIDCGVNGGLAKLDGTKVELFSFRDHTIHDLVGLFSMIFMEMGEKFVMVERVHAMPSKFRGCSTSWTLAESYATIRTLLSVHSVPYDLVLPETWQKCLGCKFGKEVQYAKRKKLLRSKAQSLYPGIKITEDTADALLIASYAKRYCKKP